MDQEKLQLTGANTIRKDRRELDFYPTPPAATIALMKFLNDRCMMFSHGNKCTIWEPACGELAMSKVMESFGHTVISTDISSGQDFLSEKSEVHVCDAIITNPPFNLSEEFIRKSLTIAPVVCMLLKSQYWHAKKRIELFELHRPAFICPLTWRVDFLNGTRGGRPTMEVHWCIWIRGSYNAEYRLLHKP